jgi:hypothetical protein
MVTVPNDLITGAVWWGGMPLFAHLVNDKPIKPWLKITWILTLSVIACCILSEYFDCFASVRPLPLGLIAYAVAFYGSVLFVVASEAFMLGLGRLLTRRYGKNWVKHINYGSILLAMGGLLLQAAAVGSTEPEYVLLVRDDVRLGPDGHPAACLPQQMARSRGNCPLKGRAPQGGRRTRVAQRQKDRRASKLFRGREPWEDLGRPLEAGKSAHGVFGGAYPFGFAEGSFQYQLQGGLRRRRKWSKAPGFNSLA